VRRAALLAAAATAYLSAAWMVAPGFYDGIAPPQPYNFVCPPVIAGASSGTPASGHLVINVVDGVSDANSVFTDDGQIVIGFLPGSFKVTGKTTVTVDITPVSPCPNPKGLHFSTNAYNITADAPLVMKANLVLRYSNLVIDPSFVYRATSPDGPWTNIGASSQAQIWTVETTTDQVGYFAAGYPSNSIATNPGNGSNQILPITVAVLIVAVLLAGIPLTVLRRRQARGGTADEEDDDVPGGKI
jgi:hypothetical protein